MVRVLRLVGGRSRPASRSATTARASARSPGSPTGRRRTAASCPRTATPKPGDLILFGTRHVGIVESVNPDGSIVDLEGNSGNAVSRVTRKAGEATGFVSMG